MHVEEEEGGWRGSQRPGSGSVESANKLVVEARLKGTGMHWQRNNVNPMLALRNGLCNERWLETWQTGLRHLWKQQQLLGEVPAMGNTVRC